MKVHRLELVIVDFEGFGVDEFINCTEQANSYYTVQVIDKESASNEEAWSDDNPLNMITCTREQALAEFDRIKNS